MMISFLSTVPQTKSGRFALYFSSSFASCFATTVRSWALLCISQYRSSADEVDLGRNGALLRSDARSDRGVRPQRLPALPLLALGVMMPNADLLWRRLRAENAWGSLRSERSDGAGP